jgi:alpha-galactosidase
MSPQADGALLTVDPGGVAEHPGGWTSYAWPAVAAEPHALVALRVPHAFARGEWYLREGWQSWSAPAPATLGAGVRRPAAPARPQAGRRHWLTSPPYRGDESYHVWRSASLTAYVAGGEAVFVAGADGLAVVREQRADGGHPDVWVARRAATGDELASRLARPRPPAVARTGWSTWDVYGPLVRGEALLADLDALDRRLGDTVEVVNVDDGWQRTIGDWVPHDRAMARALAATADRRRLSLWWAPFVVHPDSELVERRPDWLLRDGDGRPVVVIDRDDPWAAWALDLSHPEVVDWLAAQSRRLAGLGASLLKCDFLYASAFSGDAARAGTCFDPSLTGEQLHRRALGALRTGGAALIGCGAPLWPSIGLVELMRIGPDVGRRWWRAPAEGLEPEHASGCLSTAWAAARRRAWMDGALWRNDPDSVFLGAPALDRWLDWVAGRGLPLVLGDPVRSLPRAHARRWMAAVERHRAATAA